MLDLILKNAKVYLEGHTERGTFCTETMAAAAGGVTTILEQPISVPPQHDVEILERRIARAEAQCVVDFAFYGAAGGEYLEDIAQLAADGRIVAYKTFLHAPRRAGSRSSRA